MSWKLGVAAAVVGIVTMASPASAGIEIQAQLTKGGEQVLCWGKVDQQDFDVAFGCEAPGWVRAKITYHWLGQEGVWRRTHRYIVRPIDAATWEEDPALCTPGEVVRFRVYDGDPSNGRVDGRTLIVCGMY